jgi:hypothetical protein
MGHYDSNREFDEILRATRSSRPGTTVVRVEPTPDPKHTKAKMVKFEVTIPTEVLSPYTFRGWTDGAKWVCDTTGQFTGASDGVGVVSASLAQIEHFIDSSSVSTFYVIASKEEVAMLVTKYPKRDIRHLVMK